MTKYNYQIGLGYPIIGKPTDFKDLESGVRYYTSQMLNRLQSMFKYEGLPNTMLKRDIELLFMTNGWGAVTEVKGDLYAFFGGLGGQYNAYYMPTLCTVSNPALNFSKTLEINRDCIIVPNDSLYIGLLPLLNRYATMLAQNDNTLKMLNIASRASTIVTANDDRTRKSAEEYLKQLEKGEQTIVSDSGFDRSNLATNPYSAQGKFTECIELQQYLKASMLNDLGLSANYNMKREAINSQEAQIGNDSLLPLVDNMLETRQIAFDKVNKMFGTSISVELDSAWKIRQEIMEMSQEEPEQEESENETETDIQ